MNSRIAQTIEKVTPLDRSLELAGQAHLDNLTKPKGSLGRLENLALQAYLVQNGETPQAYPARIYTVAGDHGVADEGVSLFPQEVSRQMILNFLAGGAGINVLSNTAGIDLKVVNAGVKGDDFEAHPDLIQNVIRRGTGNLARESAMTREECERALCLGMDLAEQCVADGIRSVGTGDMGIANTTPSTALYCAYLGLKPEDITGPGTGLNSDGVTHKIQVISKGLELHKETIASGDPIAILAAVGGLEIATLAGLIIGCAANRIMVAVDGFISTAAYTAAQAICPAVSEYCVLSHASAEPGFKAVTAALKQEPLLHLGLRLGEGTGAALALFILKSGCDIWSKMATFADAGVSEGSELPS